MKTQPVALKPRFPMLKPIVDEFNRFVEEKEFPAALSPVEMNNRFLTAIEKGDRQKVETLLGIYPIAPNDMVPAMGLCIAARRGDAETVRLLLGKGVPADVCLMGKTPAEWAEKGGHDQIADMLKEAIRPKTSPLQQLTIPVGTLS